ncbi:uncharacterized protein LOC143255048 [Tachypleus tridentatus]|uniref:uncharacterized protein LOC143255048 n=1 Tax=Tachypleus tridentatus TaxID=6853 RepID=UPI003FD22521
MDPNATTLSKDEVALRFQENWRANNPEDAVFEGTSPHVDDGLTSLNWLQNLNIMTKLGAPTPPTPPASPVPQFITRESDKSGYDENNWKADKGGEEIDYKSNGSLKPPFSYATLICMAMKANKNKMTLSSIYKWIRENFMYYKNADPSWQNSIRHNLSLNKSFVKVPRSKDEPGKGGFWKLDPNYAKSLVDGVFKKRRSAQKQTNSVFIKKTRKDRSIKNLTEVRKRSLPDSVQDTPPASAGTSGEVDKLVLSIGGLTAASTPSLSPAVNVETINYSIDISNGPETSQHKNVGISFLSQGKTDMYTIDESVQDDLNVLLDYQYSDVEALQKFQSSEDAVGENQTRPLILDDDFLEINDSPLPNDLDLSSTPTAETFQFTDQVTNLFSSDWWSSFQQTQNDLLCLTPSLLNFPLPSSSSSKPSQQQQLGDGSNVLYPTELCLPASPSCVGFDHQMALEETSNQPWADCKAALEAAALDLERFNDYDASQVF